MSIYESVKDNARRNLHYISTEEGAKKVAHLMASMVMDTHNILCNAKKLKNKNLNMAGIIAGLLITSEINNTISAISSIAKDFETIDGINRLKPKIKKDGIEVTFEKSAEENTKESSEKKVVGNAFI